MGGGIAAVSSGEIAAGIPDGSGLIDMSRCEFGELGDGGDELGMVGAIFAPGGDEIFAGVGEGAEVIEARGFALLAMLQEEGGDGVGLGVPGKPHDEAAEPQVGDEAGPLGTRGGAGGERLRNEAAEGHDGSGEGSQGEGLGHDRVAWAVAALRAWPAAVRCTRSAW